jgi:hypothetical protein
MTPSLVGRRRLSFTFVMRWKPQDAIARSRERVLAQLGHSTSLTPFSRKHLGSMETTPENVHLGVLALSTCSLTVSVVFCSPLVCRAARSGSSPGSVPLPLPAQRLSLAEASTQDDYPHLKTVLRKAINWEVIRQQYDMMVKYATALKTGTAVADALLRRFTRSTEDQEMAVLALHLIQVSLALINTLLLQEVLDEEA